MIAIVSASYLLEERREGGGEGGEGEEKGCLNKMF